MSGIIAQNSSNATGLIKAAAAGGAWTKIKTLTASSSATLSFVDGSSDVVLDSTYPIYCFQFISIHPETDNVEFQFNMSTDSGSNYNVTKTTTYFHTYHDEGGTSPHLGYHAASDLAQSTSFQRIVNQVGNDNDQTVSGELYLFNPSSTTFVKQFLCCSNFYAYNDYSQNPFVAGYGNTTSAVDAIQFKMSSDNIDAGTIKLYGLGDS